MVIWLSAEDAMLLSLAASEFIDRMARSDELPNPRLLHAIHNAQTRVWDAEAFTDVEARQK